MGGLVTLPQFQKRFDDPSPTLLGFIVGSYDVSHPLSVLRLC